MVTKCALVASGQSDWRLKCHMTYNQYGLCLQCVVIYQSDWYLLIAVKLLTPPDTYNAQTYCLPFSADIGLEMNKIREGPIWCNLLCHSL